MKPLPILLSLSGMALAQTDAPSAKSGTAKMNQDTNSAENSGPAPATTTATPQQKGVYRKLPDGSLIQAEEVKVVLTETAAHALSRDAAGRRRAVAIPALLALHPDILSVEARHLSSQNWINGDELPETVRKADGSIPRIARNFNAILQPGADALAVRAALQRHPDVARVDLKYIAMLDAIPNDPLYSQQWAPPITGLETAWDVPGRGRIRVAVIDTGVDLNHQEFAGRIVFHKGYAHFDDGNAPPSGDDADHGTHVAGIIAAERDDGYGVAGYSNDIDLMVLNCAAWRTELNQWVIVKSDDAMDDAVARGAHIINCSFEFSPGIEDEVEDAYDHGVLVVHAAGNAPPGGMPVDISGNWEAVSIALLTVTATRSDGATPPADIYDGSYSNFGAGVDFAAPGTTILSTIPGGHGYKNGTSMAAPQVSGAAALIMSLNPSLMPAGATRHLLQRMALDRNPAGWDNRYGFGVLRLKKDVLQAVRDAGTFVSSASTAAETGTYDNPWRSIPAAVNAVPDGAVLVLNGGTVTVPSFHYPPVTISKPCTLTAIPDRPVVIGAP